MSNDPPVLDDQMLVTTPFKTLTHAGSDTAAACFMLLISEPALTKSRVQFLNQQPADRGQPRISLTEMPSLHRILEALRQATLSDDIQQGTVSLSDLAEVADSPQALWTAARVLQEQLEDDEESGAFQEGSCESLQKWLLPLASTQETTPVARAETTTADSQPETDSLWHPFPWLLIWKQNLNPSQWQRLSAHARPALTSLRKLNTPPDIEMLLITAQNTLENAELSAEPLTDNPADVWTRFKFDLACHRVFQYPQPNEADWQTQIRTFCGQLQIHSVSDLWLETAGLEITDVDGRSVERHLQTLVDRLQQEEQRIQLSVSNAGTTITN